jgi:hypothetical protein
MFQSMFTKAPSGSPIRMISPSRANDENARPSTRSSSVTTQKTTAELLQTIEKLQNDARIKDSMMSSMQAKLNRLEDELTSRGRAAAASGKRSGKGTDFDTDAVGVDDVSVQLGGEGRRAKHEIQTVSHTITDDGGRIQRKMGTRGSVATANVLEALEATGKSREETLAERFLRVFQAPEEYIDYLSSAEFCDDLANVCQAVSTLLEDEPRCSFLQSPVYVIGDIHGNLEDLHFFADNVWKLGMDLTAGASTLPPLAAATASATHASGTALPFSHLPSFPATGKFLFLGDYVDRGMSSLECVAYLFGLKVRRSPVQPPSPASLPSP